MNTLTLGRVARPVPAEFRSTFFHLYLDIAWFGILSGSSIAFVAVYATRLGAAGWELGLLSAGPALVGLFATLPAGRWLENRPIGRAVFWTSVLQRLGYLPWLFLPLWFTGQGQVWAIIITTLLMSIPGTALAVSFNAMFASAVPAEWRGQVAGTRNALLALTYIGSSLLCGALLSWLTFPLGYQVVFGLGFVGGALSSLHLWFVHVNLKEFPPPAPIPGSGPVSTTGDQARPGLSRSLGDGLRTVVGLRFLTRSQGRPFLTMNLLRGSYGRLMLLLFAFHLAQFLANPLYPLYYVNQLALTDPEIGIGTALFYVTFFFGSTQLNRMAERMGNRTVMTIGMFVMSCYPFLTAITTELSLYLITAAIGGLAWAMVQGALGNYLLERIPEDNRPAHLALYILILNASTLLGSLGGPFFVAIFDIYIALFIAAAARVLAALVIWRWKG